MRSPVLQSGAQADLSGVRTGGVCDAVDAAGACAWSWDDRRGTMLWEGAVDILRHEPPRSLEDLDAIVHEEDRERRRAAVLRAIERREPWACTFRLAGPGVAWIEERGRAVPAADGVRAAALLLDVTRRREAEVALEVRLLSEEGERRAAQLATGTAEAALRALARSEAYLESIFASMQDGLILFAPDGRISRMNPTARQMLGFGEAEAAMTSAERMSSRRLRLLDGEGTPVSFEELPIITALRGESVQGRTYCIDLADGRKFWAVCGAAPIHAPDGSIGGAVLTLGDVTRLREVQEQREDLSRMISHDLRTPLGVILAQAKLIGRRSEGLDVIRTRAEAIATSAQRMTGMLNDLVESALLESGKLQLERQPVDLAAMAADLRRRLAAPYDGERIRVEAADDVPRVDADPNRLERALENLFTNALKYSEPGSEVVVRVLAAPGEVVLEVVDRGPGIRSEDLPHLFERYFRALAHGRFEGMGLGLYTARRLVEAHGGTIAVTSVPGQGSTFRVRLPG